MLKTYITTYEFFIDEKRIESITTNKYLEEEHESKAEMIGGNTFDSLCEKMVDKEYNTLIPANRWERALWSKKRRIEFFERGVKTWKDNGELRQWAMVITEREVPATFSEILHNNSELVTQYLVENGLEIVNKKDA